MPKEQIFFHKGLAYDSRRNLQQEGFLKQAVNITYGIDGEQTIRPKFTNVNTTKVGAVHSIRRFRNIIVIGDGTYLRFRSALSTGDFTDIGSGFTSGAIWTFREYKQFLHGTNGTEEVLIDENGNCFPATIDAPVTAPTLADSSSAGNPNGCYVGYVSYEITFPNGMKYETGLSTGSGDVTVASEKINWSAIPTTSYAAYYVAAADAFNAVKLLLHCEGLDGSTTITDSSGQHTVTASGAVIDTAQSKFMSGSLYFDGTNDFIYIDSTDANINDFYFGTGAFCIDKWVRLAALPAANQAMIFYSQRADVSNMAMLTLKNLGGAYSFDLMLKTSGATAYPIKDLAWATPVVGTEYHIALIRGWGATANSWTIAIGGTSLGAQTSAATYPNVAAAFNIGAGTAEVVSSYPPAQSDTYVKATSEYDANFVVENSTNPAKSLTGNATGTAWAAVTGSVTNQRVHIDAGTAIVLTRLYYENYHSFGLSTDVGVKTFTLWGSNSATSFAELTYGTDTGWTQLTTSQATFDQHAAADSADPKYITVTNSTAYRYYAFKFADNYGNAITMGLRRIELNPVTTIAYNGWMGEYRVTKGAARFTAAFTAPTSPGFAPAIKRKLYRGPGTTGTLGDIYYVDTVDDNTTTTYTDNSSDATIGANDASIVDDYCPPPDSHYVEYFYGRAFWIDDGHPWRLYYAEAAGGSTAEENEAIIPMATEDENWDDLRVAGFEDCEPQGLVSWGTNLYIPLRHTWIKKQGNDPDTWSYKKTWSRYGVAAPYATAICPAPAGVIFLATPESGECGLCLFNGASAEMFTSPKLDYIFNTDLNKTYIHMCRGTVSGHYYHLLYPSGSNTDCDKWLAIDLRRFPDIRVAYWEGLSARCFYSYTQGTGFYVGTSDGYVKYLDSASTETMGCYIETHELIGGSPALANEQKALRALHYNINTNSTNVYLAIYIDGTQATWPDGTTTKTITGSGDAVQVMRDFPPNFKGYNFRIYVYAASGLGTFTVYSPWSLSFDAKEG